MVFATLQKWQTLATMEPFHFREINIKMATIYFWISRIEKWYQIGMLLLYCK